MNFDGQTAFDDRGRPVPIVEAAPTSDEQLEDALLDRGVHPEDLAEIMELCRQRGRSEAVALLAALLSKLDGSAAGAALRIVIFGQGEKSIREVSKNLGCSHVAILKQVQKIEKRLGVTSGSYR